MIDVATFRANFPEFSSSVDYPNSVIQFYITLAYQMLDATRWQGVLDQGAQLYVAHNVVLAARDARAAAAGGIPGQNTGPVSSKSVGGVSLSYDTNASTKEGDSHWNLTTYGTRFRRLSRMFGAGPQQVGIGYVPYGNGMAWPGPSVIPGFTNFS